MEDVNPSGIRDADPYLTAGAIRYAGGDWVVPADTDLFATYDGFDGPLGAFDATTSGSSLDVTIDGGEGFVGGSWLATDEATTVTLTAQTDTQRVYVGWNRGTTGDVLAGLDSAFGVNDPKTPIWEFDTDGSGVASSSDLRALEERIDVRNEGSAAQADNSGALGSVAAAKYPRRDIAESISGDRTYPGTKVHYEYDSDVGENPWLRFTTDNQKIWGVSQRFRQGYLTLYDYLNSDAALQIREGGGPIQAKNGRKFRHGSADVLDRSDESGLEVARAGDADGIGQNTTENIEAGAPLNMHNNAVGGLPDPAADTHAVPKKWADDEYIHASDRDAISKTFSVSIQQSTVPGGEWAQTIFAVRTGYALNLHGMTYRNPAGGASLGVEVKIRDLDTGDAYAYSSTGGYSYDPAVVKTTIDGFGNFAFRIRNTNDTERTVSGHMIGEIVSQ